MFDLNVFAVLTPKNGETRRAFALKENKHCLLAGDIESLPEYCYHPTLSSREPTPEPPLSLPDVCLIDRLLLTFDHLPREPSNGFQFGTKRDVCDILLGRRGIQEISARQCRIIVDEKCRIWLRDECSSFGTAVAYEGVHGDKMRKNHQWILALEPGHELPWQNVSIHAGHLEFEIAFPNHAEGRPEYMRKLQAYVDQCKTTTPLSGSLTPARAPIYIDSGLLGRGAFGEVRKVMDCSTAQFYAAKQFPPSPEPVGNNGRKRKRDAVSWIEKIRAEMMIMANNPHPNVMRVIGFEETPLPSIIMEYCSMGNLADLRDQTIEDHVSIFRQILLGLDHLHGRGVAHRDIKPANILLKPPLTAVIADFGLSKIKDDGPLQTFCGTAKYTAPEVHPGNNYGFYDLSVDIWSTGVLVMELVYDLPPLPPMDKARDMPAKRRWNEAWVLQLTDWLLDQELHPIIEILSVMIVVDSQKRFSARHCLDAGYDNGLFRRIDDGRIADVSETTTAVSSPDAQSSASGQPGVTKIMDDILWAAIKSGMPSDWQREWGSSNNNASTTEHPHRSDLDFEVRNDDGKENRERSAATYAATQPDFFRCPSEECMNVLALLKQ